MDGDVEGSALQRLGDVGPDGRRGPEERVEEEPERVRRADELVEGRPQGRVAHAAAARRRVAADARRLEARRRPAQNVYEARALRRVRGRERQALVESQTRQVREGLVRPAPAHRRRRAAAQDVLAPERVERPDARVVVPQMGRVERPRFVVEPEHNTLILLDRHDERAQRREDVVPVALAEAPVALVREARF